MSRGFAGNARVPQTCVLLNWFGSATRAVNTGHQLASKKGRTIQREALNSKILLRPLVDAVKRLLQIFERIGYAEAQIPFAKLAEGGSGESRNSGLLQ